MDSEEWAVGSDQELNPATAVMELAEARREIARLEAENLRLLALLNAEMDANRAATHAAATELALGYRSET